MIDRNTLHFLAGIAHELRTPLGAIGGHAELLRMGLHGPLETAQLDVLNRIRRNQEQMIAFITECMAYASAAAGDVALQPVAVPVDQWLHQAMQAVEAQAAERAVTIVVTIDEPIDETGDAARRDASGLDSAVVFVDRRASATMLGELLADALAGCGEGKAVQLGVVVGQATVTVTIESAGTPIAAEAVESVFVPFSHGSDGSRSAVSTRPLSLSHARVLARASGGDVVAVTGGTSRIVRLWLPRRPEAAAVIDGE